MDWKKKIVEQGSKVLENPEIMRWLTDDRVMKVAEGLMDAPERLKAAAKILRDGYQLPNVDPALDEDRPTRRTISTEDSGPAGPTPTGSEDMEESMS
jgi:hypothetical protein